MATTESETLTVCQSYGESLCEGLLEHLPPNSLGNTPESKRDWKQKLIILNDIYSSESSNFRIAIVCIHLFLELEFVLAWCFNVLAGTWHITYLIFIYFPSLRNRVLLNPPTTNPPTTDHLITDLTTTDPPTHWHNTHRSNQQGAI